MLNYEAKNEYVVTVRAADSSDVETPQNSQSRDEIEVIPIRCNHATNHIQQGSHPSFPRKRESIRPPSINTATSLRIGITITVTDVLEIPRDNCTDFIGGWPNSD